MMEHLGEAQPRRGVLVLELKSMIKDLLFAEGGEQEKLLLGFAKMNRSQLAEKARQLQIPVNEKHTRGHLIKIIKGKPYAAIETEGLGLPGFRQVRSQDVSRSSTDGSRLLQLGRSSGSSTIPLETQEILDVAEDPECIPGNKSGKQYDSRTDDKTHQTARKTIRGNASIERTRSKTQDSQTERSHLKHSLGGGEQRAEGACQEVDGTNTTTDGVFARAWGGEFGRELCGMADTCCETTMSTSSNEETSWLEDQVRHSTAGLSWDRLTEHTRMILA